MRVLEVNQTPVLNDAELVISCTHNDAQAWHTLVRKYRRLAFASALRILPRHEAEDATQETFVALDHALKRNHPPISLPRWISTTARRKAIDILRKNAAAKRGEYIEPTKRNVEIAESLWEELDTLPRAQRAILASMLRNETVTDRELARKLGLKSANSVAVQRAKAIAKLQKRLGL